MLVSLKRLDNSQEQLKVAKRQAASLQSTEDTVSRLEKELSISKSKLGWVEHRLKRAERELEETKCKLEEAGHKAIDLE